YVKLYDDFSGYGKEDIDAKGRLMSVKDSVITLGICKKINQTLTQKQKLVVLVKLLELVARGNNLSLQRKDIINTVSTVFNISQNEYHAIEKFVRSDPHSLDMEEILLVDHNLVSPGKFCKHLHGHFSGALVFLRVRSVNMYFAKYLGVEANMLNGFIMEPNHVYLFTHGSTIKAQAGDALYYSDLIAHFNDQLKTTRLSFNAKLGEVKFHSGNFGLREIVISEGPGKLIGIMGASGAGKSTLLNALAGLIKPEVGEIRINGFDIHRDRDRIHGVIGYVSQDDLLIEDLTVYQNLFFNARLCFANLSKKKLDDRVMDVLHNLGLDQRRDLRVGNTLEKVISGGQRKRLNIALELIREPAILFLDEPTSGLSSRDSENVIDLLKELSLKGKLIFVVIHQPSSDIYKMFDKMIIMDTGGYPAYYGPPVEAITYFKKSTHQVDSNRGQCKTCGNVNPEQIFNIMEARVVDEYGEATSKRKVSPAQWYELYKEKFKPVIVRDLKEQPPRSLQLPNRMRQTLIFTMRDTLAKLSNRQYLLVNLLEAPLLALLLAFIIKYKSDPGENEYVFRFNENFPAFILMSIIVALFMGLSVSAEEIIRDRKILKRESFLHLSWNSYLLSKLIILFGLSAIQTFSFVLIGHTILEIEWKMLFPFWFVLFSLSCMANVMGLNISSAFRSAVTVYVLIPLLIIPQMILSGLLFRFEKLNDVISTKGEVPIVADLMASRWAYEAMAVYHFMNNSYERPIYGLEKVKAQADFRSTFLVDELEKRRSFIADHLQTKNDSLVRIMEKNLRIIQTQIRKMHYSDISGAIILPAHMTLAGYTPELNAKIESFLAGYKKFYHDMYNRAVNARERQLVGKGEERVSDAEITRIKNQFYNESLADLLTNISEKNRIIEYEGQLVQQVNPVFLDPEPAHAVDYRAHYFAPKKNLLGNLVSTYWFNLFVIWIMTVFLYGTLYIELLKKIVTSLGLVDRLARTGK
ncbi:MAG TPA: ATP-binding cassette domain-containing protein, partial [Chryseosolibacter sp.]|nr:ATP-binding cassette domain-containing protein [Chryseosolibacter sp.]